MRKNKNSLWEHDGVSSSVRVERLSGVYLTGVFDRSNVVVWDGESDCFRWMNGCGDILEYKILDVTAMKNSYVRFYIEKKENEKMDMETIDKLYLELSRVSQAKTAREIELEKKLADTEEKLRCKTEEADRLKENNKFSHWENKKAIGRAKQDIISAIDLLEQALKG